MTLNGLLVVLTRLVQRLVEPAQSLIVASEPRVGGSEEQRKRRRVLQVALRLGAEVLDDLRVATGRGELLRFLDYE